jgi:hypothetical protein
MSRVLCMSLPTVFALVTGAVSPVTRAANPPRIRDRVRLRHGAAKSVIPPRIQQDRATRPYDRATCPGATPGRTVSVRAQGLEDGLTLPTKAVADPAADVSAATHIFAIGCSLPSSATGSRRPTADDISGSGYAAQRDAIKDMSGD